MIFEDVVKLLAGCPPSAAAFWAVVALFALFALLARFAFFAFFTARVGASCFNTFLAIFLSAFTSCEDPPAANAVPPRAISRAQNAITAFADGRKPLCDSLVIRSPAGPHIGTGLCW